MPSYALNQFIDMDDTLCRQLLSLDLGEMPKTSVPPGYKKPGPPCAFSSSSVNSNNWTQPKEASRWNKMGFWSERAISMVEGSTEGLGWSLDKPLSMSSASSLSNSTSLLSSSTTSSRYKTELCRTFSERGVCKYGSKCQFAHGVDELRGINRHPKYKTEPCRTFHSIGFCPYGIRCHFVHNNDDDSRLQSQQPSLPNPTKQRPQLKHSYSFAGFPSTHQSLDSPLSHSSFLRAPSASPPSSANLSDILTMAFPELSPSTVDQTWDPLSQFSPSPDSGCSSSEPMPTALEQTGSTSQTGLGVTDLGLSLSLGARSLSLTSLSDHEGCCSSASSLSGSDSAHDAAAKRLPIFSQLSVPDDGFCSEDSASFFF
ncbi:mRNA decay activator protein ZFP36L1 [Trichomycterus rosablanca]|uniref:mRNA decay activator protein ZFP36L1 n=1 Tax=Trichomycterus rosablanca TaxID=2290929 RepID=UPI002F35C934